MASNKTPPFLLSNVKLVLGALQRGEVLPRSPFPETPTVQVVEHTASGFQLSDGEHCLDAVMNDVKLRHAARDQYPRGSLVTLREYRLRPDYSSGKLSISM